MVRCLAHVPEPGRCCFLSLPSPCYLRAFRAHRAHRGYNGRLRLRLDEKEEGVHGLAPPPVFGVLATTGISTELRPTF